MSDPKNLDGKYVITTQGGQHSADPKQSDGFTLVKDGKTLRVDGSGCEWRSSFVWIDTDHVKMSSIVDPTYAADDFFLIGADGQRTREAQHYEATLTARRDGDHLQLDGYIELPDAKVHIVMRRVGDV